jgi:hypothetical protein
MLKQNLNRWLPLTLFSTAMASSQGLPEQRAVDHKPHQQAYVQAAVIRAVKKLPSGYPANCPASPARENIHLLSANFASPSCRRLV